MTKRRRSSRRWAAALATTSSLLFLGGFARAQPSESELNAARNLFAAAERDEDAGDWQQALDKLDRVSKTIVTAGVRYHFALCHEQLGQLATALAEYLGAEKQAEETNAKDVLQQVGARLQSLMVRTPRLAIDVGVPSPGIRVTVDGVPLDTSRLGSSFPANPGVHHVEVRRPGAEAVRVDVQLKDSEVLLTHIGEPPPAAPPAAQPSAEAPVAAAAPSHALEATPVALAAGATMLTLVGAAAYLTAGGELSSGARDCQKEPSCAGPRAAVRAWDWTALGAWTAAATSAGLAIVLWLKPAAAAAAPRAGIAMAPDGIRLMGTFE